MSKTQLYIGTDLLDFNEPVNIKRQVNDWRDVSLGGNVTTYTINVPLTRKNRPLLGFIDDVRSREEVTEQAKIIVDGMEVISGKLRILRSNSNRCTVIIKGNDWVGDIAGVSIKDISWAGGDEHTFTSANIVASWSAGAGALYRYPLINFGELVSGDFGSGGSAVYSYDFYMAWNVEEIVTKIFLDAGYTVAGSGFFASAFGQALYVMSAAATAQDDFITGKAMKAYVNDSADNFDTTTIGAGQTDGISFAQQVVMDAKDQDEGVDYSIATHRYTAPEDGTYRLQGQIGIWSDFNQHPDDYTIISSNITFQIRKNGAPIEALTEAGVAIFDNGNNVFSLDTGYIHLEAGDYIDLYSDVSAVGTNDLGVSADPEIYIIDDVDVSYLQCVWSDQNLWPGIGKTISPSEFLPDIDSVEFLQSLKQFANLRFFVDRNNKTVYIETSDDFYGSTVIDWTDKIDYSDSPELEVLASNYKKNQKFKWAPATQDNAYINHVSANGVPFQKELTLDSEYVKAGTEVRENASFSPTVLGDMPQIGHWASQKVPRIFGGGEFVSDSRPYPASRSMAWGPRIMEWKGLVALSSGNFDYYEDIEDASPTNYTTFPSMETPDMNDMFADFMSKDWNRIDKNKLIPVTLKLTPAEIMKFRTVVGTPENEGFRATYKTNIEGIDMYFNVASIVYDGDRAKAELIQKL